MSEFDLGSVPPTMTHYRLGRGAIAVGAACVDGETVTLVLHPLPEPLVIGHKVPDEATIDRDFIRIDVENLAAARVLLHAVQTIHDVLSGAISMQEARARFESTPASGISW